MSAAVRTGDRYGIGQAELHAPQQLLGRCLVASLVCHALVFLLVPGWSRGTSVQPTPVLDVVMVPRVTVPPAVSPHQSLSAMPKRAHLQRQRAPGGPPRTMSDATTAPAQPASVAPSAPALPAEPQRAAMDPPAVPAADSAPLPARAETAGTPPVFNAAYLRNPPPRYPLAARRNGEEGQVMLKVLVNPDGTPVRVELDQSSGSPLLDGAALEAVHGWRFVPARRGAQNVEGWVRVPLVFRLES